MVKPATQQRSKSEGDGVFAAHDFDLSQVQGLSREALELHLDLYRGYVKAVNELLAEDKPTSGRMPASVISARSSARFAFEWNGMTMHESFFETLAGSHDAPLPIDGCIAAAAKRSYGGLEQWQADCLQLAETRGVGWVVCSYDPRSERLFDHWVDLHHFNHTLGTVPVLVLDLWEHAWISDFKPSERADYFQSLWGQINWAVVEARAATPALLRA
jgi:Fe-Mn family superoxide dismutase